MADSLLDCVKLFSVSSIPSSYVMLLLAFILFLIVLVEAWEFLSWFATEVDIEDFLRALASFFIAMLPPYLTA